MINIIKNIMGGAYTDEIGKALLDALSKSYVPKADFNEKIEEVKQLRQSLSERDSQLAGLQKATAQNADLQNQINALVAKNKESEDKFKEDFKKLKIETAKETALAKAGARNIRAALALLDSDKITFADDGKIYGIDEQIKALKESDETKFLFAEETLEGYKPAGGNGLPANKPVEKMSYAELCDYLDKGKK